jgi:uncharacterized protein (TIGR02266 family)
MWVEESRGHELYFQRSANLSTGGLFLENTIPHPVGTQVALKFSLPGDPEGIKVRGEIVGSPHGGEELGMSVKFIELDAHTEARIAAFVSSKRG